MSLLTKPRAAAAGTVYTSKRCDACGREVQLTRVEDVATVTSRTRPGDITQVELCADWRDCIDHFPKEDTAC